MKRVFSGARPTGKQHLGNYLGAIQNYVALQDEYTCIYCIVDVHALTSLEDTGELQNNIYEMIENGKRNRDNFVRASRKRREELQLVRSSKII